MSDTTIETPVEVSGSEVSWVEATPIQDTEVFDLESLFADNTEQTQEDQQQAVEEDPTFYAGEGEAQEQVEPLNDDELALIDEQLEAYAEELIQSKEEAESFKTQLEQLESSIKQKDELISKSAEMWEKIIKHPQLGKLADMVIKGQEVELSSVIDQYLEEQANAIPDVSSSVQNLDASFDDSLDISSSIAAISKMNRWPKFVRR